VPKEKSKQKEKPIKNYQKSKMKTQMSLPKSQNLGGYGGLKEVVNGGHADPGTTAAIIIKDCSIIIIITGPKREISITQDVDSIMQQSKDLQPRIKITNTISVCITN